MPRRVRSPEKTSRNEPPGKKEKTNNHRETKPVTIKENLLKAILAIESEIKEIPDNSRLRKRIKDLRRQADVVQTQEDKIKRLEDQIDDLKLEVDELKKENEKLKDGLAIAQATWLWEAHLARFVIDDSRMPIETFRRFKQMRDFLKRVRPRDNLWIKIQRNIGQWTAKQWKMVNTVRK